MECKRSFAGCKVDVIWKATIWIRRVKDPKLQEVVQFLTIGIPPANRVKDAGSHNESCMVHMKRNLWMRCMGVGSILIKQTKMAFGGKSQRDVCLQ